MNKQQHLGLIRAFLTALGTSLATWGITDGHQWLPVIGIVLAFISLGWGWIWHRDPATPGKLKWSLVRKFINVCGTAAITYGIVNPERVVGIEMLVFTAGPLLAAWFSWIDNSPEDPADPDDKPPFRNLPIILLLAACIFLLPGCAGLSLSLQSPWGDAAATPDGALIITPRAIVIPGK